MDAVPVGIFAVVAGVMLMVYGVVKAAGGGGDHCSRCRDPMPDGYHCYLPGEGPICRACGRLANLPPEWDSRDRTPPTF